MEVEDVFIDLLNEDICRDRRIKWQELAKLEEAMKQHDPVFKGFYPEENYCDKLNKCIENFDALVASIPNKVKKRGAPSYSKDYIVVEVDDQDQPKPSSWAQRRKK